ncbi:MAG TPA: DeoR/GlpR family DNA-binding transcription regulator [Caulobacteraceae bacterium]|jgi:DeoR/GlpR family transcriptional regulator of sugar metabolism
MLTEERRQRILTTLARDGRVVAKDVSTELSLSEDTIRRDLRQLAAEGLLQRVHGGALPASRAVRDLQARGEIFPAEKQAIGRAAAAMVTRGQVVFVDGGTTALWLARALDKSLAATVVTHSPVIAAALADHAAEVILIGGRLYKHSMVSVGAAAAAAISQIRADTYFMGVTGVHASVGFTTGDAEEAQIKRALMASAAETVVLASPEKLGAASPFVVAAPGEPSTLVTAGAAAADLADFERLGLTIVRA